MAIDVFKFAHVLSGEEKFQILECISLQSWNAMPAKICSLSLTSRIRQMFSIEINSYPLTRDIYNVETLPFKADVKFVVDKDIGFLGVDIKLPLNDTHLWTSCSISVVNHDYRDLPLVCGSRSSLNDGTLHIELDQMFILKCYTEYRIYATFPRVSRGTPFYYHRVIGCSKHDNQTILEIRTYMEVNFTKWYFKAVN